MLMIRDITATAKTSEQGRIKIKYISETIIIRIVRIETTQPL